VAAAEAKADSSGPRRRSAAALRLAGLAGVAFLVRVWFRYDDVFPGPFVRFAEADPWYHMRLVENLLHHFPWRITYDPYMIFGGQTVGAAPLFDVIVAAAALLPGGGSPSPALVERVAAFVPPVMGALTVLPVYGLGCRLFSERAGLIAAALAAILPGQFLLRSSLGFVDHHVAEFLFSACALLFLVRAVGPGLIQDAAADHERRQIRDAVLAGLFLGAYLLSWAGGSLMVFAFVLGLSIHLVSAFAAGLDAGRLTRRVILAFGVAAGMVVPFAVTFAWAPIHLIALGGGAAIVALLATLGRIANRHPHRRLWIGVLGAAGFAAAVAASIRLAPELAGSIRGQLVRVAGFKSSGVDEAMPLLWFSLGAPFVLLLEFGLSICLALAGAWWAGRSTVRGRHPGRALLLGAFLTALGATVGQTRFTYYLAVPVAVLAGAVCDRILVRAGRRAEPVLLALVLVVFVPIAFLAPLHARAGAGPTDDWHETLTWLRANSPEPLGDAAAYDGNYEGLSEQRHYPVPASAYSVASWWTSGYWIMRVARRIPVANPTQAGIGRVAEVLLAENEAAAANALARFRSRYVIVDELMTAKLIPGVVETYGTVARAAESIGRDTTRYYDVYYRENKGALMPLLLYYPAYYERLGVRMQAFEGRGVVPADSHVVIYREDRTGPAPRQIVEDLRAFASYDEAGRFVRASSRPARIVGTDPLHSCVPIQPLRTLTLVHTSPTAQVRVFEFDRNAARD
jgi:oligosaccharyl transferase (archaeosortase A-associated)